MKRKVTGTLKNTVNDVPVPNATISIEFVSGDYSGTSFYIPQQHTITTDVNGNFSVDLWCNEGNTNSYYFVTLPGFKPIKFILPEGTADIPLSVLIQGSLTPREPEYDILLNYIEDNLIVSPSSGRVDVFTITTPNTTQLLLTQTPNLPHLSQLSVNGVIQTYVVDYTINERIVNWVGDYNLEVGWNVQIFYS